ncbi:glycosyltransferase [Candidatus Micrarchaeota archaeon]|nr:glycosyltransferase [Candidatus Micrarchaeota archaeon]
MRNPHISVVIPSYNERENIGGCVEGIENELKKLRKPFEIVVVDDNSPDGTADEVRRLGRKFGNVRLLGNPQKKGIGYALHLGLDSARGAVLVTTDADSSIDPSFITRAVAKMEEGGYGVVVGCRHMPGGYYEKNFWYNKARSTLSRPGNRFIRLITGIPVDDFSLNFRAVSREAWKATTSRSAENGNAFMFEMVYYPAISGFGIGQIPVRFMERTKGETKTRLFKAAATFFRHVLALRLRHGKAPAHTVRT